MAHTIWVDVEDLFEYFVVNPRPSGIQRLAFEIMRELAPVVRFVRRGTGVTAREVAWAEIEALFGRPPPAPPAGARRFGLLRGLLFHLPPERREPLIRAVTLQRASLATLRGLRPAAPPRVHEPAPLQPGDHYLLLGAPWAVPGAAGFLAELRATHRLTVALLLYDLIPVRHPEWCLRDAAARFESWLAGTLPVCDRLMAISDHTARDVEAFARESGIALAAPVGVIPVGTGLPLSPAPDTEAPGLPRPGYVLFVSTLEARKNHALVVRVWRRLMDEVRLGQRAAGSVPTLVFAGRIGWMVADLVQQLDNTAWLNGRIRLVRDPTDAELRALYDGCLFTIFPSLFEGWGLPVSESLAAGKPCLAAATTALPEAGGALCRYFDPYDVGAAHRAVTELIDTPGAVAAWQEQVRREFRATAWRDSADAVLRLAGAA